MAASNLTDSVPEPIASPGGVTWSPWSGAALAVAVLALAGSLHLSIGLGLKACPLCLYQRTFVMGIVAVLGVGLLAGLRPALAALLALPLAAGGLGVALFHEYLEAADRLECPAGLFGLGTAPQQSLVTLCVVFVLLLVAATRRQHGAAFGPGALVGTLLLGVLFSASAVASAPPMPAPPTKPYEQPLDICRPPFRPA